MHSYAPCEIPPRRRETNRWTFFWNPPSTKPRVSWFLVWPNPHIMRGCRLLWLQFLFSSHIKTHRSLYALYKAVCVCACVCTFYLLYSNVLCSYIIQDKHHTDMLTFTCRTFQLQQFLQINTHLHTHIRRHTLALKWEWWWDTMTAPGERNGMSVLLISHLWYKQLCNSS